MNFAKAKATDIVKAATFYFAFVDDKESDSIIHVLKKLETITLKNTRKSYARFKCAQILATLMMTTGATDEEFNLCFAKMSENPDRVETLKLKNTKPFDDNKPLFFGDAIKMKTAMDGYNLFLKLLTSCLFIMMTLSHYEGEEQQPKTLTERFWNYWQPQPKTPKDYETLINTTTFDVTFGEIVECIDQLRMILMEKKLLFVMGVYGAGKSSLVIRGFETKNYINSEWHSRTNITSSKLENVTIFDFPSYCKCETIQNFLAPLSQCLLFFWYFILITVTILVLDGWTANTLNSVKFIENVTKTKTFEFLVCFNQTDRIYSGLGNEHIMKSYYGLSDSNYSEFEFILDNNRKNIDSKFHLTLEKLETEVVQSVPKTQTKIVPTCFNPYNIDAHIKDKCKDAKFIADKVLSIIKQQQ